MKIYTTRHRTTTNPYPSSVYCADGVFCGVHIESGHPVFTWVRDVQSDIITLETSCSGEFNSDDIRYIYAYEYTDVATQNDKKIFRDYLKGRTDAAFIFSEDAEEFVERGVLKLDTYINLSTIGALVCTQPTTTPALTDLIQSYLMSIATGYACSFDLIKQTYENVSFDAERAYAALERSGRYSKAQIDSEIRFTVSKFESLKSSGQLFQMKRFIPPEIRAGFMDYLRFGSDEERDVYISLQGVDVLIYNDFITSGSTVREIIRYLKSFNDTNTLTVFILVKQH